MSKRALPAASCQRVLYTLFIDSRISGLAASKLEYINQEFCLFLQQFDPPPSRAPKSRARSGVPLREVLPFAGIRPQILVTAITRQWQVRMIAFRVENSNFVRKFRPLSSSFFRFQTLSQEEL